MKKIKTVEELKLLARERKSVSCPLRGGKSIPAAVLLSMQCRCVLNYIKSGCFVYEPKQKKQFGDKLKEIQSGRKRDRKKGR